MAEKRSLASAEARVQLEGYPSMDELWIEATAAFEIICGESLQRGQVKSFEDVQAKIESGTYGSLQYVAEPQDKWDRAKSFGLQSLRCLKMLVGAASLATTFVCQLAIISNFRHTNRNRFQCRQRQPT